MGADGDGSRTSRTVGDVTTQYVWTRMLPSLLVLESPGRACCGRYFNDTVGPVAIQTPTQTYYVHRDPLGSTNQLSRRRMAMSLRHTPVGLRRGQLGRAAAAATDLLFRGQQRDPVTGLYNMRARTSTRSPDGSRSVRPLAAGRCPAMVCGIRLRWQPADVR